MRPYEFALLRYQHDLDAGEFANVGVVLYDVDQRRLLMRVSERYKRLSNFFGEFNGLAYKSMLQHVERALARAEVRLRQPDAFDQGDETLARILASALPGPDSCILCSAVMSGVSDAPEARLAELFEEFVTQYEQREESGRRDDEDVRRDVANRLIRSSVSHSIKWAYSITAPNYYYEFQAGWMNGKPQVLEPISFDLAVGKNIIEKANNWTGRLLNLSRGNDFAFTAVVAPPSEATLGRAFQKAIAMLNGAPCVREIVVEDHAERVLQLIQSDLATQRPTSPYSDS